jgi:hypothetical protein
MAWYIWIAYFVAGLFLVNAVPHFVMGVCGRKFPSPFSKPPGKGLSSPLVNVLWGAFNLVVGYLLMFREAAPFFPGTAQLIVAAAGGLAMAIMLATHFGEVGLS